MPSFRVATSTEGVDTNSLNYYDYCTGDNSAVQQAADVIDALGIDPRSENIFLPNAAILRTAEAVDSIANVAVTLDGASANVSNTQNTGRILCSIDCNATLTFFTSTIDLRAYSPRGTL